MFRHLPNLLTTLRLFAAPLTAFLIVRELNLAALGVFVFAGLSDAADGYLAKRFSFNSRFGTYLDPAADKLLMLACFVTLTSISDAPNYIAPLWLTALVIGRDVAIVLGLALAHILALPVRVAPLPVGKASTGVQVCYIGVALFVLAFNVTAPRLMFAAAIAVAAVTAASWLAYAQVIIKAIALRRGTA